MKMKNATATTAIAVVLLAGWTTAQAQGTPQGPLKWLYEYDAQGNPTVTTGPLGAKTEHIYDTLQRRRQTTQPLPLVGEPRPVIKLDYDLQDQLGTLTDPRNLATQYTVNGIGDVRATTSPDSGAASATYYPNGLIKTRTDARGKLSTYSYDAMDRLTRIDYTTGAASIFTYDGGSTSANNATGALSSFADASGSTAYGFDGFGRVSSKTQIVGSGTSARNFAVGYAYGDAGSANGHLQSITYPSGAKLNYTHDAAGRILSVSINPVNTNGSGTGSTSVAVLDQVGYHSLGSLQGWRWADAKSYSRGFDANGRLQSYPLGLPGGANKAAGSLRTLSYDDAGRISGYTHSRPGGISVATLNQIHGYDGLDRLRSTQLAGGATTWGYKLDATGNRSAWSINGASYPLTISPTSNRIDSLQLPGTTGAVSYTYSHDTAGNVTGDGRLTYTYNDRGRMSRAKQGTQTINYAVNALEQRVGKSGPTGLIPTGGAYYVYDEAGQLLGEYDATGIPIYETVYIGTTPVAVIKQTRTGSGATLNVQTSVSYVYADHLETPRVITRASDQAIVWRWDAAEAFGATAPNDNPNALGVYAFNPRMPGQIFDAESGNFYNWNRDYSPPTGRYIQSDPIGLAGGINTYSYTENNPVSFTDPRGLVKWNGTFGGVAYIEGVGAAGFRFDLTSECKCGKIVRIQGYVSTVAAGLGMTLTGSGGNASFFDFNPCPQSDVANGFFNMAAATSSVIGGGSCSKIGMGGLRSSLPRCGGPVYGLDISAGVYFGAAVVTNVEVRECCEPK
jgi:RHS repeat-associated protein